MNVPQRFRERLLTGTTLIVAVTAFTLLLSSSFAPDPIFSGGRTVSAAARAGMPMHDGSEPYVLAYNQADELIPPVRQYREWTYLTSGLDMSYTASKGDMSMFDNVFVNPEAYRAFQRTGTWPDKTVMVLETRGAGSKSSINQSGHFQSGDAMGLEIHVKDTSRFAALPGGWAFFDVTGEEKATLFPQTATCYSCHAQHAAVDTTFVQFYPTLLPIATRRNTLSEKYRKEMATQKGK